MKLKISIDGKQYDVEVEVADQDVPASGPYYRAPPVSPVTHPSMPLPPAPQGSGKPEESVDEAKVCRSPIAGVTVRINVQVGQQIQASDALLVLEAMKMETNITSPVSGKVKSLHTIVGDGVQIGQVLVQFE